MRKIYALKIDNTVPVSDFILHLEPKMQRKVMYVLKGLVTDDSFMKEPHVKAFKIERYKGIYEIRAKVRHHLVRIMFCFSDNNIVLLNAFHKKGQKDTHQALDLAKRLLDDFSSDKSIRLQELDFGGELP